MSEKIIIKEYPEVIKAHNDAVVVQGVGTLIIGETPSGAINGSNATFTTAYSFIPESVQVMVNGLVHKRIQDFNTTGTTTILLNFSPETGETITVNYQRTT